ncbi:MAG: hypothetical protein FWC16_00670 [Defluviitaleaceae bacterium]|nr:hypothetical protein [Defluviitaleaceae bacterium]MCL2273417.1 hypothetical protein [Defluviitaleaceae bacterium]
MSRNITKARHRELSDCFWRETTDPETQGWRNSLTEDESVLVGSWDFKYTLPLNSLCERIIAAQEANKARAVKHG